MAGKTSGTLLYIFPGEFSTLAYPAAKNGNKTGLVFLQQGKMRPKG
jgi:hypothetical protein